MNHPYRITKYACYTVNLSMSVVGHLSPLLFLTFRSLYGISFSMLGALVFLNFFTQLAVDLLLSFYSHRIPMEKAVGLTPALTAGGLLLYALFPFLFPDRVYLGLVLGTLLFAASGGLAEVLISPVIAAIPAENPEREMSKLHSVYAWGVVGVVILSTLFLSVFGREHWQILALLWLIIPVSSCILFSLSRIPPLKTPEKAANVLTLLKQKDFWLCFFCIFLGGASECTMSQWSSSYLEYALGIPKVWGDVLGVALFAMMLGLGRSLYAKLGGNIRKALLLSALGATVCYFTAALTSHPILGLTACALTGFAAAILWPGSLIVATNRFPASGVAVFALMAAGGDLGAALGTQLVGTVIDLSTKSPQITALARQLSLTPDQLGMKIGILAAAAFPLLASVLFYILYRKHRNQSP